MLRTCLAIVVTVTVPLLSSCSDHRAERTEPTPVVDTGPPLVRSDREIFEPTPPAVPDEPDQGSGNGGGGGGNGRTGVGIGNGGGGGRGAAVPEPATLLLVGGGLAAAAFSRRRRRNTTS